MVETSVAQLIYNPNATQREIIIALMLRARVRADKGQISLAVQGKLLHCRNDARSLMTALDWKAVVHLVPDHVEANKLLYGPHGSRTAPVTRISAAPVNLPTVTTPPNRNMKDQTISKVMSVVTVPIKTNRLDSRLTLSV